MAVSIAFNRTPTFECVRNRMALQQSMNIVKNVLTIGPAAYNFVQYGDKFSKGVVRLIYAGQDSDDIGAWVCIFFGQYRR